MSIFKKKKPILNIEKLGNGVINTLNKDGSEIIEEDICLIEKLGCVEFEPKHMIRQKRIMENALRNELSKWSSNAI